MPRYTISRHTGAKEGNHYDLMLEEEEALATWRVRHTNFESQQTAGQLRAHRKTYLDFEGPISGKRGKVEIWDRGTYEVDLRTDDLLQVSLHGETLQKRLRLQRMEGSLWKIVDATAKLRRIVSRHLRTNLIESEPPRELAGLGHDLSKEEQKLLAFVARYARGEPVDWSEARLSPDVRERLLREWAHWRHPWLDQARLFADRLDRLAISARKSWPTILQDASQEGT